MAIWHFYLTRAMRERVAIVVGIVVVVILVIGTISSLTDEDGDEDDAIADDDPPQLVNGPDASANGQSEQAMAT